MACCVGCSGERMGNVISEQMARFLQSILLGGVLGLWYDLLRPLRRLGGRIWGGVLDVLVSTVSVFCVFFFTMAGDGELRLFVLLGVAGGVVLFFCLLSQPLRPIWDLWFRVFMLPVGIVKKFFEKLWKICKKLFSFWKSWFTIIQNTMSGSVHRAGKGETDMANGQATTKKRPSSRLTAVLLLVMMLGIGAQLYNMYGQLRQARQEEQVYAQRLAQLQETNQQLAEDIANSGDADLIEEIARNDLGMATADEKIFRIGK